MCLPIKPVVTKTSEREENLCVCRACMRLHTIPHLRFLLLAFAIQIVVFENLGDNKWLSEENDERNVLIFLFNVTFLAHTNDFSCDSRFLQRAKDFSRNYCDNADGRLVQFDVTIQTQITWRLWHLKALLARALLWFWWGKSATKTFVPFENDLSLPASLITRFY